ncbi:hypothetical protein WJ73_05185 [Burkholderia ubonensis]|nr:hypothetical protein WJ73_05185 [Burkholderia ubonensis]
MPTALANGGIGYDDVSSPQKKVAVRIGPLLTPAPAVGDLIALYWDEDPDDPDLDLRPIAAQQTIQDDAVYFVLNVEAGFVFERGSGAKSVFFRLRTNGSWLYSEVVSVDVKLDKPGDADPESATEWINENLLPPVPEYTTIGPDEAAAGVNVTVPKWINIAEGDRLTVAWSTQRIDGDPLLPGNVGDQVVHVPPETIEAGGDGEGLIVRYEIYDRVKNWSKWSLEARVNVEIDPDLLARPVVMLAPSGVLDLDQLGSQDVEVMVMDTRIVPPSVIELTWDGRTAEGNPVVRTVQDTLVGSFLILRIPNEAAVAIAQGLAVLSYTAAGVAQRSRRTTVRVIGEVQGLEAPVVEEAVDDVLDPAGTATVRVDPYVIMDAGDRVLMHWSGTKANNESTLYTAERWITTGNKGQPVYFPIPAAELSVLNGGSVRVAYWVYPAGGGGPLEAPDKGYRINAAGAGLPPPEVDYVDVARRVLDPDWVPPAGTTLRVPAGALTLPGDNVKVEWLGRTGQPSDTYRDSFPVTPGTAGQEVPFLIAKSLVSANLDGDVTVRYDVVRNGQTLPSQTETFRVGAVSLDLPAPEIEEASGSTLDPTAARGALTAVVNYAGSQPADEIQVTWTGNGESGSTQSEWIAVGSVPRQVPLDHSVVAFNLGRTVTVAYEVRRAGQSLGTSEPPLTLSVQHLDTSPDGPLPTPQLREAVGDELDLDTIVDQGHVTVTPPWPLIAVGQRFWLDLEGAKADGSPHSYAQANGVLVNAQHVANGLTNRQVPKSYFDELGHATALRLVFKVAFDGANSPDTAVAFPVRTLTVRALEIVTPTIDAVTDPAGNPIPNGGTTVETSVTLTGTASIDQQVEILDGATSMGTAEVDGGGIWTKPLTGLSVAAHSFTAKGLYGDNPVSEARTVTVTTLVSPTITSVRDNKGIEIPHNGRTPSTTVTLRGTASVNQKVEVFDGATSMGTAEVDGGGIWTKPLTGLSVAAHSFTVKGKYGDEPVSSQRTLSVRALFKYRSNFSNSNDGWSVSDSSSIYPEFFMGKWGLADWTHKSSNGLRISRYFTLEPGTYNINFLKTRLSIVSPVPQVQLVVGGQLKYQEVLSTQGWTASGNIQLLVLSAQSIGFVFNLLTSGTIGNDWAFTDFSIEEFV